MIGRIMKGMTVRLNMEVKWGLRIIYVVIRDKDKK